MTSDHRSDTDEGELEDAYLEVKPIIKLENKLSQITSKIKDIDDVKKTKTESFNSLDKAFEGLKSLVDRRKQHLAQLKVTRKHQISELEEQEQAPQEEEVEDEPKPQHRRHHHHHMMSQRFSRHHRPLPKYAADAPSYGQTTESQG